MASKSRKSKKQSSTNSAPPEPQYFADRDLGNSFVDILRKAGIKVEAHRTHFAPAAPDPEWLPVITDRGWVAFSKDKNLRKDEQNIDCIMNCGARVFVAGGNLTQPEYANFVVQERYRIAQFIKKHEKAKTGAYVAKIARNPQKPARASIEIWVDTNKWRAIKKRRNRL